MAIAKGFLILLGVVFLGTWLLCVLGIVAAFYRSTRTARAQAPGRLGLTVREVSLIPGLAVIAAVNVLVFIASLLWHRLLGRPLPPAPKPWERR